MTRTISAFRTSLAVLLALTLCACATRLGRNFDEVYAQQIKPGETTRADIVQKLGRPSLVTGKEDEETWTYAYYEGGSLFERLRTMLGIAEAGTEALGKQKRLVLMFKGSAVTQSQFTEELPLANRANR